MSNILIELKRSDWLVVAISQASHRVQNHPWTSSKQAFPMCLNPGR